MLFNKKNETIFCFLCNKWLDARNEVFLDVLYEGSISCQQDHLIGHSWDFEWEKYFYNCNCPYYYIYNKKGQCRCVQEETKCEGLLYKCENRWGKKCYEEDLEE